jgi:hypothetical protein
MTTTTVSGSPVRADIRAAAGVNDSILAIGRGTPSRLLCVGKTMSMTPA